tara:strand:+ start:559 stop:2136 length:1578 start_codon:yes stop_codon:yes gene_type:complete
MATYKVDTKITTSKGDVLEASKSGTYTEVFNIRQEVDNTGAFITLLSTGKTMGAATINDCRSLLIKNIGNIGAEIQYKIFSTTTGSDADVIAGAYYVTNLLGAGDFIYLPNIKINSTSTDGSLADADALTDLAPAAVRYVALNNADAGDAQLTNDAGTITSDATHTTVTVDDGGYFFVGDLIRLEDEICEVTAISGADLTIRRGLYGSTAATHANNTAIRLPFFNMYTEFTAATGGYDVVQTDASGRFKAMNFFGYGRNTDDSDTDSDKESMGIVPGSISGKFYQAGFQELGLSGITSGTHSGLAANTTYYFKIAVDGGTAESIAFTTDSTNLTFGGSDGILQKIQDALDADYYLVAANIFEQKVKVSLVGGDIRFTSGQHLSTSAIALSAGTDGGSAATNIFAQQNGRFPILAKVETAVPAILPNDEVLDKRTGVSKKNAKAFFYDDGHGNIKGACSGNISYDSGAITLNGCPPNASFVVSANWGSTFSGGNRFSANDGNCINTISARSANQKLNTTIDIIGLK